MQGARAGGRLLRMPRREEFPTAEWQAEPEVRAAGGAVYRPAPEGEGIEVLVVHRPRYDDWSLPKGKLDPGETFEQAAIREVEEETGLRCKIERALGESFYIDHKGRYKLVRYWLMAAESGEFKSNHEVDEVRWLEPGAAVELLTHERDRELVETLSRA